MFYTIIPLFETVPQYSDIIRPMATLRTSANSYNIGSPPPELAWTLVRGDTASFKVYVTNDATEPLFIPDWDIEMDIKRDQLIVTSLSPQPILDQSTPPSENAVDVMPGEFLVELTSEQSQLLATGDVFDIQMTNDSSNTVWTVARGTVIVIEDITR